VSVPLPLVAAWLADPEQPDGVREQFCRRVAEQLESRAFRYDPADDAWHYRPEPDRLL
jgi:hypothetical protein